MNKLSKIIFILAILVVFSNFVCAQEEETNETELPFEVNVEKIKDRIDFEENAEYKITIKNPRNSIERFVIKPGAPYVEWFIKTKPASDYNVKVYPNSEREVFVVVKPLGVGMGLYSLRMNVKHEKSKELFEKDLIVNIISMSNVPAVSISGSVPTKIDPREPFVVKVWLENRNSKNLEGLGVQLKSDEIRESTVTSLGPVNSGDDKKTLEFSVQLDDKTPPIKDYLRIFVTAKDEGKVFELKSTQYEYEILEYGKIVEKVEEKFRFLGSYKEISFFNDANVKYQGIAKVENPFHRALFTKATPKPEPFIAEGKRYIMWDIDLGVKESFDVVIEVSYIPFFIFVFVFVGLILAYFRFRSPIILTKSTQEIIKDQGGITQFKVILHIKNRSKKHIENVAIIDRVPDITNFEKEKEVGTLQPLKVVHTKRGIIAKWVINGLDREEETVIKYCVKSRLSILGKIPLAYAIAKFKDFRGKVKRSYSNSIEVSP